MRLGVAYPTSARFDSARRDLDAIAAAGVSSVLLGASEDDVLEEPERLASLVAATRERGLEPLVSPRGVLGLFGGGGTSFGVARDPSIRQRLTDGTGVPAACPNNPRTGAWLERWLVAALASRPDGVAWLEPRLWVPLRDPWNASRRDAWACACDACVEAWALGRHDAPGGALPDAFTPEVRAFRRRSLVGLLEPSLARVDHAGLRNIVSVAAAGGDDPEALPLGDVAAIPYVHGLGTEPCGDIDAAAVDHTAFWAARIAKAARGRSMRTHLRVRTDRVRAGRAGSDALRGVVAEAVGAGIDLLVLRPWPDGTPQRDDDPEAPPRMPVEDAWAVVREAARS